MRHTEAEPGRRKQRTNVTIDPTLISAAREFDLNVSAISEAALSKAVSTAKAEAWKKENADALAEREARIEKNGMPLAKYQTWQLL